MQFTIRNLLILTAAVAVACRLLTADDLHQFALAVSILVCCLGFCLVLLAGLRVLRETIVAVVLIFLGAWLIVASLPVALVSLTVLLMKNL